jgi:putative SOS response-associated peptidase YedK
MCGRFTLSQIQPDLLAQAFNLDGVPDLKPRYNIAPTQIVPAILRPTAEASRQWVPLKWGLVPSWSKDPTIGTRMINARAETILEKPSFRTPFQKQRCLIPADGFYEWQATDDGKQPYYIRKKDRSLFAFAGLWDYWEHNNEVISSCTIITTEPNQLIKPIHHRMAVMLQPDDYDLWLASDPGDLYPLIDLLKPFPDEEMEVYPVSTTVNNARHDATDCIEQVEIEIKPKSDKPKEESGGMKAFDFGE